MHMLLLYSIATTHLMSYAQTSILLISYHTFPLKVVTSINVYGIGKAG